MNEFDTWRSNYETMTYQEQIEYHNNIESRYPEQAHYTLQNVFDCFSIVGNESKVLEFGCWKGDLAQICIPQFQVKEWLGVEICVAAIEKTKCDNPKFSYWLPDDFNWFETTKRKDGYDFIIATHFIEHLSNDHFESLVKYCDGVKHIYFEAPLSQHDQDWNGYIGTHKLIYGWEKVESKMLSAGYQVKLNFQEGKLFEKVSQ